MVTAMVLSNMAQCWSLLGVMELSAAVMVEKWSEPWGSRSLETLLTVGMLAALTPSVSTRSPGVLVMRVAMAREPSLTAVCFFVFTG